MTNLLHLLGMLLIQLAKFLKIGGVVVVAVTANRRLRTA